MIESFNVIKCPDSFQYESLRLRVFKKDENYNKGGLGLAMFLRQGMLSWINAWQQYAPESFSTDKQSNKSPMLPSDVQSEMTKVLANITLCNIEESV
ncbi:MAG: hypothetical protein OMM_09586 [Candidatus Magnetoglobus multicellularis str. Araruama]|uniref:Uncharacterized protein n=1 Tax=Candidatus Magnetoglobus multicellularis str. Araruama TaxID=890399 RepID=A0A1V1P3W7_9BACT|nr:MAG: hypothetical protein OMM_09586 [Candidatus Magnetoglobus multicellularis str. Araruama]